jgi:hypothetical protein
LTSSVAIRRLLYVSPKILEKRWNIDERIGRLHTAQMLVIALAALVVSISMEIFPGISVEKFPVERTGQGV